MPNLGHAERWRVFHALESTEIAYGEQVDKFERAVQAILGLRCAIAVSSGTAALHLALLAAGVGRDDEVLMPTLTFVAPANAICYAGARPVLFDVEREYRQIDVDRLARWAETECRRSGGITVNRRSGRRIGAILTVDLLGHPCDIDGVRAVADRLDVPLIDDAAESFGASFRERPLGDGADIVCLSFNANKIVTCAGGGMLLCDREDWGEKVRHLASQAKLDGEAYVHDAIGFNYRMAAAQAALGLVQVQRLEEFRRAKRRSAEHYARELGGVPGISLPREAPWAKSTYWLYAIHVDAASYGMSAAQLTEALGLRNIASRPIFTPLHQRGIHAGRQAQPCPVAEYLGSTGLILPSSSGITAAQLACVTDAIRLLAA